MACFIHDPDPRSALELSAEEREEFWEQRYLEPGFGIWIGNFKDILTNQAANDLASEFAAKKIRQRVNDPKVADLLIPKNHGFGTCLALFSRKCNVQRCTFFRRFWLQISSQVEFRLA